MKVCISAHARYRGFYLAKYLEKLSSLSILYTSYPKFKSRKLAPELVEKTVNISLPFLSHRLMAKFSVRIANTFVYALHEWYDRSVANAYSGADIIHCWSSYFLNTLRKAKKSGSITIVDRASAHILTQQDILCEEAEHLSVDIQLPDDKIIAKELKEYEEADYISIPSHFVKRTFLEQGIPEEKLIHVPYGVDLTDFRPVPKEDKTFRIIHCGGISMQKGVHYLLQAFYELNLPDAELWLIGGMNNEIKPFLKKYDNGRVFHKGPYPQNQLYKYYSQGSVFCLASIQEGFGMVMPQAMACGLPVICTTNTGGEDIVRDGVDGFIIPIRDVEALKEKILFMYENPERCREMGKSARLRVQSGFSWDDYGEKMIGEYRKVLAKR